MCCAFENSTKCISNSQPKLIDLCHSAVVTMIQRSFGLAVIRVVQNGVHVLTFLPDCSVASRCERIHAAAMKRGNLGISHVIELNYST